MVHLLFYPTLKPAKEKIMRILHAFLAGLLVWLAFQSPAAAKTVLIPPAHDAQVVEGKSDQNFGTSGNLYVASANGGTYKNERAWLRFDLAGQIPAGATIQSARLWMYCYYTDYNDHLTAAVHSSQDDTWTETAITWDDQPAFDDSAPLDQTQIRAGEK